MDLTELQRRAFYGEHLYPTFEEFNEAQGKKDVIEFKKSKKPKVSNGQPYEDKDKHP